MLNKFKFINILCLSLAVVLFACNSHKTIKQKEIVKAPEKMDEQVSDNIKSVLDYAASSGGKINDSVQLSQFNLVNNFYTSNNFSGVWSKTEKWNSIADSMFDFIKNSMTYGLYPEDYHFSALQKIRSKIENDSLARMDAVVWTKADLMLTDAFMNTLKDLKEGRMVDDSVSIVFDKKYIDSFFIPKIKKAITSNTLTSIFENAEPKNIYYTSLKEKLPDFVKNMDTTKYTYINFPYSDTVKFYTQLHERLVQSGITPVSAIASDSVSVSNEVKKYQAKHNLKIDGKPGQETIYRLNSYDFEKFRRIAVTLDRYKEFPEFPEKFLMVNIPSFALKVWDNDTVVLTSKVIVGKPSTPTPVLQSAISNMVTYPNWTIPESIIKKDILPALKVDPGYLASKGFSLVDYHGQVVDPYSIKWSKYKNGIPWKVVQGSGDDNALGIFKFNFSNPYSVYLHDTNQRYLFANSDRALSHGCVRVQKWEELAFFITKNDSLAAPKGHKISYNADSIKTWIANEDRKSIMVKKKLPLYIEYFTCEATKNKIAFYKDIYNKDQELEQKYFVDKVL
jgi:murein L,D-transpeptidase YcbB/YkuD